jgi:hypothetical protein
MANLLREGILVALEDYPNGAYVDDLWAYFDNVPTRAYVSKILVDLVKAGEVRSVRPECHDGEMSNAGMNRRKKYYLVT